MAHRWNTDLHTFTTRSFDNVLKTSQCRQSLDTKITNMCGKRVNTELNKCTYSQYSLLEVFIAQNFLEALGLNLRLRLIRCIAKCNNSITGVSCLETTFQIVNTTLSGYNREDCRALDLDIIIRFRSLNWIHIMTIEGLSTSRICTSWSGHT